MTNHPIGKVRQLQRRLYLSAKKSKTRRFHALYERIHDWEVLKESWKRVRQNHGSHGIDGQTIEQVEAQGIEPYLRSIQSYLKEGRYHPMPVRTVEIPKSDGTKRSLGIPTIRDRVVQMAAKIVLEPIFEADFQPSSFGYSKNYFGSIDHGKLLEAIRQRVSDQKVMKLIRKMLKAGVMQEGNYAPSRLGTPQGGVISPLLSNIYLHKLDEEWEETHKTLGTLVRYCDDFVVLAKTQRSLDESQRRIQQILQTLSLELHPKKTQRINLAMGRQGFNFLGWYLRKCPSARFQGKYFLNRWPSKESMKRIRAKIRSIIHYKQWVKNVRELALRLNPVLRGWVNYFRTGNSRRKFQEISYYLWERLVLFENKRRHRKRPCAARGGYTTDWFKSLGFFDLVQPGLIRYPLAKTLYA
jgi:RNA-directed DNA polymerase